MAELTEDEYWFLLMWSNHLGVANPQGIIDLGFFMLGLGLSAPTPEPIIDALVKKRVLDLSPDRRKVKFTDYGGPTLFDLFEDANPRLPTRIITSSKVKQSTVDAYRAYRTQYASTEMRLVDDDIHDRYILWDDNNALHIGHSLKDLGTKDTQINLVADTAPQFRLFEERWKMGRNP